MNFPHLSDTSFPNLSNVNVYRFRNSFDYTRWNEKSKIKLCNVLWNSDYADVVKWDTDEARDRYFDGLTDVWTVELMSSARIVPEGFIKLPIPYDVMARYNYLFIDMPIATSIENPIDYENPDGIKRWYFFIQDITYLSPNATQVYVLPDIWTNFQNKIDIPYMLLERGHAPVYASDTDEYLANPIENNRYLLAPDVNFDNAGITKSSTFVPFGNGKKYVCFASTCTPDLLDDLGEVVASSAYNPSGKITYSDYNARFGHQLIVNGLSVGNGYGYSNANTPAAVGHSDGNIANNLTVYAIAAKDVYGDNATYFTDLITYCPQFLTTVKACFVVDEGCITLGTKHTWRKHDIYECKGKTQHLLTKNLEKADFDYPAELQRFAKLYTSPYSQLEITDNNGNSYEVNIEETSTLSVNSVVSVAFPYINERVYIDGIGGVGSKSYTWVDLKGNSHSRAIGNSDWFKFCFDWEIPTFALYMDGETAFMLESFNRNVKQAIKQSLVNYHNNMRSANTAYENACDQADTAYTNTTYNAYTAKQNAIRSADTAQTNSNNSADTQWVISRNNSQNAMANGSINAYYYIANEALAVDLGDYITRMNNQKLLDSAAVADVFIDDTTGAVLAGKATSAISTSVGQIASGALSGATTGAISASAGGPLTAATGAAIGAAGGAIQAATTSVGFAATSDTTSTEATAQKQMNTDNATNTGLINTDIQNATNTAKTTAYNNTYTSLMAQLNNNASNESTNRNQLWTTQRANAKNTRDTIVKNANDTYDTTEASARRTRNNVKDNAWYTRQVGEYNAKETLENGQYASMAAVLDARNSAPVEVCSASGNPTPDYMQTRGVQIKVKTQNESAIRQTGDIFARFGYTLNQIWDVENSGLKLMKYFTYWKAKEIWVDDAEASNNNVNVFIRNMFLNGVTVWNDPTKIGKVNVYSN